MYSLLQGRRHVLRILILPLAVGASLACPAHASPGSPQADHSEDVAAQEAFRHAVDAQRAAIDEENAKTKPGVAWAGDYYSGDGLGANISLSLAPRAGVAATWQGCLGTYASNKGAVTPQADGSLLLRYEEPNDPKSIGFADHVVPVPWGERMYLIPENELAAFASEVNLGMEPRKDAHGIFLMREGDESRKVYGMPLLPTAQRSLIHDIPVQVGVLSVKQLQDDRGDHLGCRYRLELDHGANDGLAAGMKLDAMGRSRYDHVTLENVTPTRSVGTVRVYSDQCGRQDLLPLATTRFTSGAYHAIPVADQPRESGQ
jgi:hypothetical protein